jgi:hypothetical protein
LAVAVLEVVSRTSTAVALELPAAAYRKLRQEADLR